LDENGKPVAIDRVCGNDLTGTLYIGCEEQNFAVRSRLSQLVRSLREPRLLPGGYPEYSRQSEHPAGYRLRSHSKLNKRFPRSHLALTWCYSKQPNEAESSLLRAYVDSFGEIPPLNRHGG
jgi:hypothetical protein